MTRLLSDQEVLHDLTAVGFYNDTGTTTTTTSANVVGDGTAASGNPIQFTSVAGFAVGDVFRLGAQGINCDVCVIEAINTLDVDTEFPIAHDHASATAITLLTFVNVGDISEDGVQLDTTQDETPLRSGVRKGTFLFIGGAVEEQIAFSCLGFNPENLVSSVGDDEADVNKVGATYAVLNPDNFASQPAKPWALQGVREDLLATTMYLANLKVSTANQSIQWTTGQAATLPWTLRSTGTRYIHIE